MTQHMASLSHSRAVRKSLRQSSPAPSTSSTREPALMERVATAPPSLQAPPVSDSRRSSIASMDDGVSLAATGDNHLTKPPIEEEEPTAAAAASASIRSLNLSSTPPPEELEETVKTPITVLHIDIPQTPEETQTTTLTPATSVIREPPAWRLNYKIGAGACGAVFLENVHIPEMKSPELWAVKRISRTLSNFTFKRYQAKIMNLQALAGVSFAGTCIIS